MTGGASIGGGLSEGMYFSVECGEDMAFTSWQKLEQEANVLDPALRVHELDRKEYEFGVCQRWKERPVPTEQKQPVVSSLPTLVLSGEYDPITPPSYGRLAMQTLKHGMLFSFPATGHGVLFTNNCPDKIVSAFLQNPTTQPDSSCLAKMTEPDFL